MKLRKTRQFFSFLFLFAVISVVTISASTTKIIDLGPSTFVTSEHGDGFFADEYVGTVSIRGTDRFYEGNAVRYPKWVNITYNVQGTIYKTQVNSTGKSDSVRRMDTITVKDKWNLGSQTKVYGNYESGFVMDATINSLAVTE